MWQMRGAGRVVQGVVCRDGTVKTVNPETNPLELKRNTVAHRQQSRNVGMVAEEELVRAAERAELARVCNARRRQGSAQ